MFGDVFQKCLKMIPRRSQKCEQGWRCLGRPCHGNLCFCGVFWNHNWHLEFSRKQPRSTKKRSHKMTLWPFQNLRKDVRPEETKRKKPAVCVYRHGISASSGGVLVASLELKAALRDAVGKASSGQGPWRSELGFGIRWWWFLNVVDVQKAWNVSQDVPSGHVPGRKGGWKANWGNDWKSEKKEDWNQSPSWQKDWNVKAWPKEKEKDTNWNTQKYQWKQTWNEDSKDATWQKDWTSSWNPSQGALAAVKSAAFPVDLVPPRWSSDRCTGRFRNLTAERQRPAEPKGGAAWGGAEATGRFELLA